MASATIFPVDFDQYLLRHHLNKKNPPLVVAVDIGSRYCKAAFTFQVSITDSIRPKVGLIHNYAPGRGNCRPGAEYQTFVPVVTCTNGSKATGTHPVTCYWGYQAEGMAGEDGYGDDFEECWPLWELDRADERLDFATEQLTNFITQLLLHVGVQIQEFYRGDTRPREVAMAFSVPTCRNQVAVQTAIQHALEQVRTESSIFSHTTSRPTIVPAIQASARFVQGYFQKQLLPTDVTHRCLVLDGGATTIDAIICETGSRATPQREHPMVHQTGSGLECLGDAFRTHLVQEILDREWRIPTELQQSFVNSAIATWTHQYWLDGKMKTYRVSLPGLEGESSDAEADCVTLGRESLNSIFDQCRTNTRSLLDSMLNKATESNMNVTKIAMVGGLARLKFITRPAIRDPLKATEIKLLTDPEECYVFAALYGCLDLALAAQSTTNHPGDRVPSDSENLVGEN